MDLQTILDSRLLKSRSRKYKKRWRGSDGKYKYLYYEKKGRQVSYGEPDIKEPKVMSDTAIINRVSNMSDKEFKSFIGKVGKYLAKHKDDSNLTPAKVLSAVLQSGTKPKKPGTKKIGIKKKRTRGKDKKKRKERSDKGIKRALSMDMKAFRAFIAGLQSDSGDKDPVEKDETEKDVFTVQQLVDKGGTEVQMPGVHRVEFTPEVLKKLVGLEIKYTKMGTIDLATLKGKIISNTDGNIIRQLLEQRFSYDVLKKEFNHDLNDEILKKVKFSLLSDRNLKVRKEDLSDFSKMVVDSGASELTEVMTVGKELGEILKPVIENAYDSKEYKNAQKDLEEVEKLTLDMSKVYRKLLFKFRPTKEEDQKRGIVATNLKALQVDRDAKYETLNKLREAISNKINDAMYDLINKYKSTGNTKVNFKYSGRGKGNKEIQMGIDRIHKFIPDGLLDLVNDGAAWRSSTKKVNIKPIKKRSYWDNATMYLNNNRLSNLTDVTMHEFGHAMETNIERIKDLSYAFLNKRTVGEDLKSLRRLTGSNAYGRYERAWKDEFISPYMGKKYSDRTTEIFSMGLDYLFSVGAKKEMILKDSEYVNFILGTLVSVKGKEVKDES